MPRENQPNAGTVGKRSAWLTRTVLGIGLTSLLSDWSHETATAVLPGFLAAIGAGPAWLGAIEGTADGLSSLAKLAAGHYTDRWKRRKPFALLGYALTAASTASFGFATHALEVLAARAGAWFGRGARSPAKKALLAAEVPAETYGRAFGFERSMDTLGAILGPLTAVWLLKASGHSYRQVFFWTLVPGLGAVACFWLMVRERALERRPPRSFFHGLRTLPPSFWRFLAAVGIFGAGDFSHTLLILYATRMLAPEHGMAWATSAAVMLYALHNVFSASSAYLSGWLSDHLPRRRVVLAAGYALAAVTACLLSRGTRTPGLLAVIFILAGLYVGTEEALEDSLTAEIVPPERHGMAFGTLAAVNGVGDFLSSLIVGALWSAFGAGAAFAFAAVLFLLGAVLVLRLK
jgi:MFS family permease